MKKIFLSFIMIFFASFLCAQQAGKRDISRFASVNTIESAFAMSKYLSIADKPLVSGGHFYFRRPDSLYWAYETPYSYGFVISEGKILSWQEKDGKKNVKDITKQPAAGEMASQLYTFVSMDTDKIAKIYNIEYFEDGIRLLPKNQSKKQMILDIKIYFAEDITAVREVVISERSGDKTVITFTEIKIDGALPNNAFTI
jgi:outer membrane lipoprotein carrier protein